jgi:hypothetical protein
MCDQVFFDTTNETKNFVRQVQKKLITKLADIVRKEKMQEIRDLKEKSKLYYDLRTKKYSSDFSQEYTVQISPESIFRDDTKELHDIIMDIIESYTPTDIRVLKAEMILNDALDYKQSLEFQLYTELNAKFKRTFDGYDFDAKIIEITKIIADYHTLFMTYCSTIKLNSDPKKNAKNALDVYISPTLNEYISKTVTNIVDKLDAYMNTKANPKYFYFDIDEIETKTLDTIKKYMEKNMSKPKTENLDQKSADEALIGYYKRIGTKCANIKIIFYALSLLQNLLNLDINLVKDPVIKYLDASLKRPIEESYADSANKEEHVEAVDKYIKPKEDSYCNMCTKLSVINGYPYPVPEGKSMNWSIMQDISFGMTPPVIFHEIDILKLKKTENEYFKFIKTFLYYYYYRYQESYDYIEYKKRNDIQKSHNLGDPTQYNANFPAVSSSTGAVAISKTAATRDQFISYADFDGTSLFDQYIDYGNAAINALKRDSTAKLADEEGRLHELADTYDKIKYNASYILQRYDIIKKTYSMLYPNKEKKSQVESQSFQLKIKNMAKDLSLFTSLSCFLIDITKIERVVEIYVHQYNTYAQKNPEVSAYCDSVLKAIKDINTYVYNNCINNDMFDRCIKKIDGQISKKNDEKYTKEARKARKAKNSETAETAGATGLQTQKTAETAEATGLQTQKTVETTKPKKALEQIKKKYDDMNTLRNGMYDINKQIQKGLACLNARSSKITPNSSCDNIESLFKVNDDILSLKDVDSDNTKWFVLVDTDINIFSKLDEYISKLASVSEQDDNDHEHLMIRIDKKKPFIQMYDTILGIMSYSTADSEGSMLHSSADSEYDVTSSEAKQLQKQFLYKLGALFVINSKEKNENVQKMLYNHRRRLCYISSFCKVCFEMDFFKKAFQSALQTNATANQPQFKESFEEYIKNFIKLNPIPYHKEHTCPYSNVEYGNIEKNTSAKTAKKKPAAEPLPTAATAAAELLKKKQPAAALPTAAASAPKLPTATAASSATAAALPAAPAAALPTAATTAAAIATSTTASLPAAPAAALPAALPAASTTALTTVSNSGGSRHTKKKKSFFKKTKTKLGKTFKKKNKNNSKK